MHAAAAHIVLIRKQLVDQQVDGTDKYTRVVYTHHPKQLEATFRAQT